MYTICMRSSYKIIFLFKRTIDFIVYALFQIMSNKFKLYGCEASLQSIGECGLLDQFPETEKDALHIYTQLKSSSIRFGHTYNTSDRLFQDVIRYQAYQ